MRLINRSRLQEALFLGFLATMFGIIGFVFWQHLEKQKQIQQDLALTDAQNFSVSVAQFRNFYASQILPALKSKNITLTHDFRAIEGALPLPATFAKEFGRHLATNGSSYQVRLYSDLPFSWSATGGLHDDFERQAMSAVRQDPEQAFWKIEQIEGSTYLRYAVADSLKKSCVACHNSYVGTPKTNWKEGDVRGILEIRRPISDSYKEAVINPQDNFFKMLALASFTLLLVFYMMRRLKKSLQRAETLIEEKTKATELMNAEIQHRTQLGQALELNEEKLRKVVDSVLDVIVVIDDKGNILQCNQAIETLFGYKPNELKSQNISMLMPEPDHSLHDGYLAKYKKTGQQSVVGSTRLMHAKKKDGTVFPIDLAVSKVDINGEVQFTGVIKDVTQRIEAEKVLQDARDKAIESARMKSQFLANMSHEIRTPMNGIIGMTRLLLDQPLTEPQKDLAQTASNSANALLVIINDILDFSKIEAGKMAVDYQEIELLPLVEGVIDLVIETVYSKGLRFGYFIEPDVPKYINVDETRLRQIMLNLLGNAVKFTLDGEVTLSIKCSKQGDSLEFAIKDSGVGISEEAQKQLFSSFSQADGSTTRQFGGTGLGLSISKQLIELMQGDISVTSQLEKGSTFRFTLPIKMPLSEPCLVPLEQPVDIKAVVPLTLFTEKIINQLSLLNITLTPLESVSALVSQLKQGTLTQSNTDMLSIDMSMVDEGELETLASITKELKWPLALLMTPQESMQIDDTVLSAVPHKVILKPIKYSKLNALMDGVLGKQALPEKVKIAHPSNEPKKAFSSSIDFNILLVEDNLVNQKLAIALVKQIGFDVDLANNGEEALSMLASKDYDLVLMDCQMPIKDGYDTTRELRAIEKNQKHTPVVAMTANAMQGDDQLCYAAGMDDYISKPIDRDLLKSKIEHYVLLKTMDQVD